MFRMVVQDSRRTPTSGKLVATLGSYDPHAKTIVVDKEKAKFYLEHGAQPSDRTARLLKSEGVKLPDWVSLSTNKKRLVRHAEKRRSTRPEAPAAPVEEVVTTEAPVEEASAIETETESPVAPETVVDAPEETAALAEEVDADAPEEVVEAAVPGETEAPTEPEAVAAETPETQTDTEKTAEKS